VQDTQDDADGRQEALPGALRGVPAVGAHGLRAVGRSTRAGLVGTRSISGLQSLGRGRFGHGGTEDAAASHRGWHLDCVPERPGLLLVGEQVLGQPLGLLDGAADEGGPSQSDCGSIPEHRVTSEHVAERVEGHAPVAPVAGLLPHVGTCDQVRPQARGPYLKELPRGRELDAARPELRLYRPALVVAPEAPAKRSGNSFGGSLCSAPRCWGKHSGSATQAA
jgi:hypothetical protein